VEPDCCYYVQNAPRIIGRRKIDLESDPPPDIVVEIDTTSNSLRKFSIYAALAVPEIWRYNGKTISIYELTDSKYTQVPSSRFLPGVTGELLVEFIELSKTHGHTKARRAFQQRLQSLR
jgi:Uma2 family endonuclease